MKSKYWKVDKNSISNINNILGSDFTDENILYFKSVTNKNVIYITFDTRGIRPDWSYFTYPEFKSYIYSVDDKYVSSFETIFTNTEKWFKENDFIYAGEISRKSKLDKLKQLENE
jgi:hypothetical protein